MATSAIPSLNDDCAALILSMLDKASLHAIANTSSTGCAAARRFLVRDVILHSFDHAATFCRVVLASDLAHLVKRLIIEKPIPFLQHKNPGALEKFSSDLASLLERVQSLDAFALESFAGALLRKEPRIAVALLAHRPRHLSLNGADGSSLLAIRSISGIVDLSLVVQDTSEDCSPAISSIIENSANTLRTLTLKTPLPDFLTNIEMDIQCCQSVRTILMDTGRNMNQSVLRRFSLIFPNLQRLSTAPQSFALRASDILQEDFLQSPLNALTAVSGDVALIAFLAQYHSLRYIKSTDVILSFSEERQALMERLVHCPVQGAKLSIWANHPVREVLLGELAHALPHIKFFAIAIQFVTLTNLLGALESSVDIRDYTGNVFIPFTQLRYLSIELTSEIGFDRAESIDDAKRHFVAICFRDVPSLECVDLQIYGVDEERSWWKRCSDDIEEEESVEALVAQIGDEEGFPMRAEHEGELAHLVE